MMDRHRSYSEETSSFVLKLILWNLVFFVGCFIGFGFSHWAVDQRSVSYRQELNHLSEQVKDLREFQHLVERLLPDGWGGAT